MSKYARPVCFFVGHRYAHDVPEGVEFCERCQESRAYAWGDDDMPRTLRDVVNHVLAPIRWRWLELRSRLRRWLFDRCCDCGKPEIICGRPVGDHKNCIPF